MQVLVTGGAGRLGYEVAKLCSQVGIQVGIFDLPNIDWTRVEDLRGVEFFRGDITDQSQVSEVCIGVDAVVHLAAQLPPRSELDKVSTLRVNVQGTRNILEAVASNVLVVFASSVSTYGVTANEDTPISENHPTRPHDNYSESKVQAEALIANSGKNSTILRFAPITVVDLVELPNVIPYRSDQRVEFIYVEDAADAIVSCLKMASKRGQIMNVAGGNTWQMTGGEYIHRFYSALGVEIEPNFSPNYTAVDWYDTRRSQLLGYQKTSFPLLEEKLKALGESLGLR
jgi:UDP-glucose 4-epimerase